jgi:hypothetical protein
MFVSFNHKRCFVGCADVGDCDQVEVETAVAGVCTKPTNFTSPTNLLDATIMFILDSLTSK